MEEDRALTQDIRALKLVILNLMPNKIVTETQLLRALSNSPIQIDVELICTASHTSTHTSQEHLTKFYIFELFMMQKYKLFPKTANIFKENCNFAVKFVDYGLTIRIYPCPKAGNGNSNCCDSDR